MSAREIQVVDPVCAHGPRNPGGGPCLSALQQLRAWYQSLSKPCHALDIQQLLRRPLAPEQRSVLLTMNKRVVQQRPRVLECVAASRQGAALSGSFAACAV